MPTQSIVARSAMVGLIAVAVVLVVLTVLLIGASAALTVAVGSAIPSGDAPATYFKGGVWIDLAIVILLSFVSGFLLTFRRLH